MKNITYPTLVLLKKYIVTVPLPQRNIRPNSLERSSMLLYLRKVYSCNPRYLCLSRNINSRADELKKKQAAKIMKGDVGNTGRNNPIIPTIIKNMPSILQICCLLNFINCYSTFPQVCQIYFSPAIFISLYLMLLCLSNRENRI